MVSAPARHLAEASLHPLDMDWFTHFTRPARVGVPPGGRNHVRRSLTRTLCGLPLPRWLRSHFVILDPCTGAQAYPDCRRCAALAARRSERPAPAVYAAETMAAL